MSRHYCTYFDRNYLFKALALIDSLRRHDPQHITIHAICHDEISRLLLQKLNLPGVIPIPIHEIEANDEALLQTKPQRSLVEYYWTLTPTIILRLLERHPEIESLAYVDADLFFYSDPSPLWDELGSSHVLIHEHRFSPTLKHLESASGRFNVGLLIFRNTFQARAVLNDWREKCIEWCYFRFEPGRCGDQMYLDAWPRQFPQVRILQHPGAGVAPWNQDGVSLKRDEHGGLTIDGRPLVFYHFHAFVMTDEDSSIPVKHTHYPITLEHLSAFFLPYLDELVKAEAKVRALLPSFSFGLGEAEIETPAHWMLTRSPARHTRRQWDPLGNAWWVSPPSHTQQIEVTPPQTGTTPGLTFKLRSPAAPVTATDITLDPIPGHSLQSVLERPPLARRVTTAYFVGCHNFHERNWFFATFPAIKHLYLFEPLPDLAQALARDFASDPRVKVFNCAIADYDGHANFQVSNNLQSSSLLDMKVHKELFPHVTTTHQIDVTVHRLDSLIEKHDLPIPDLLYVDVQGAEYMVLSGISQAAMSQVKVIYTEASTVEVYAGAKNLPEVEKLLAPAGFRLIGFADMLGTRVHGDALFINTAFEKTITVAREQAEALCDQAEVLAEQRDLAGAFKHLEAAFGMDPSCARVHSDLAVLCWEQGIASDALTWAQEAYALAPNNRDVVINLANILHAMDHDTEARMVVRSYLAQFPGDNTLLDALPPPLSNTLQMRQQSYRITALVSTYKSAEFISECLDDLLAQTVADQIEILVIDADSPEHEGDIVRSYQARHGNIRYIRTPERIGVYAAWNMAIREARGEYLISCSTNDRLKDTACEMMLKELDKNPEVAVVYGDSLITPLPHQTFDNAVIGGSQFWPPYSFSMLLEQCMVGCHPMWRRKVHDELGLFDESYAAIGDQDMWLRIGEKYPLKHIPFVTSLFWATSGSLSGNSEISNPEVERVHQKYQRRARYRRWVDRKTIQEIDAQLFAERMLTRWQQRPSLLLITVASAADQSRLATTVASLQTQLYQDWKLIVIADGPAPAPIFEQTDILGWLELDSLEDPDLLTRAFNQLVEAVPCDWLTLIPVGSTFEPHWTIALADYANLDPKWQAIYTDHDHNSRAGFRCDPWFKPDFNLDYLRAMDYVGPALWFRREAIQAVGGFQSFPGAWQYEALWRLHDHCGAAAIGHLPEPLLHLPENLPSHPLAQAARQAALEDHLARQKVKASISEGLVADTLRITYEHDSQPKVSIIIPNRDSVWYLQPCLDGLLEKTTYDNYEVIVVDNQTEDPDTLAYYRQLEEQHGDRVRIVPYDLPFNFSAQCNLGVREASGDYVLLLNNDTEIVQPNWLEQLLNHGQRPEVGAVGARLVYPGNAAIQHAGVVLGMDRLAGHPFSYISMHEAGYMNRLQVDQDYSAVTAACILIRKHVYVDIGGMNETDTPVLFNDVDLCLRLREAGYLVVWTPKATLVHHEHKSLIEGASSLRKQAEASEINTNAANFMHGKWGEWLAHDPAYNRHLSLIADHSYDTEPILVADWDRNFHDRPRILAQPPAGGVGEYRFIAPLRALTKAGLIQSTIVQTEKYREIRHPTLPELNRLAPDTYMIQADFLPLTLEHQRYFQNHCRDLLKVVMLDDLVTDIPRSHPLYGKTPRNGRQHLRKLFQTADRVIVSTQPLLDYARELTENAHLVPNALRDDLWGHLTAQRQVGRKPRVGWAGAQQHQGDLALISEVVAQTANEVEWVFFGMCPEEIRPYIAEYHEFELGVEAYPAKLASLNLDLAIAPLEINAFNEAKSNLRLLEYGVLGFPVICTDIYPYCTDNAPVTRVANDPKSWINAIREHIHDLDATAREGDALKQWVQDHYMLSHHLDAWFTALTNPRI